MFSRVSVLEEESKNTKGHLVDKTYSFVSLIKEMEYGNAKGHLGDQTYQRADSHVDVLERPESI